MRPAATGDSLFPEEEFIATKSEEYFSQVTAGIELMRDRSVLFCCIARDGAARLPHTIKSIEATGELFAAWSIAVYENDSIDETPAILSQWQRARPRNVRVVCEKPGTPKWGMVRHPHRGDQMARCRSRAKEIGREFMPPAYYVIVADVDLAGWSIAGIAHSVSLLETSDAYCIASNGLRLDNGRWVQYDAWAMRRGNWKPLTFRQVKNVLPSRGEEPIEMLSAFGGLAIYRADVFALGEYTGGDCEHVTFHKSIHEADKSRRLLLNPAQITVTRW